MRAQSARAAQILRGYPPADPPWPLTCTRPHGVLRPVFSRRAPRLVRDVSTLCLAALLAACALSHARVRAQASAELPEPESAQWRVGAYYRHAWVPKLLLKPFLERAGSISNEGLGATVSRASRHGATIELGLGYTGYHFEGAFAAHDVPVEDTEWIKSSLGLVHLTGSVLWPIELSRSLAIELGVGLDLGIVLGSLRRSEAYPQDGAFHPCRAALDPSLTGPDKDAKGAAIPYCEQAYDVSGKPTASNGPSVAGAHYDVKETRVPPLMLVPMLPHVALRFAPTRYLTLKLEAAFGIAQVWVGLGVQVGVGRTRPAPAPAPAAPELQAAPPEPALAVRPGRVIGKLLETGTNTPIAHASVRNKRLFSAIESDDKGLFAFENQAPGTVHLEITHPGYEPGSCDVTIPAQGGDAMVHCLLRPVRREGAISGHVQDEHGKAVAARVEITGPASQVLQTDAEGLFAVLDVPDGTYRLKVQAPGFLPQILEIELKPRETAMPQIILLPLPAAGAPR